MKKKSNLKILIYHNKGTSFKERLLAKYPKLIIKVFNKKDEVDNFLEEAEVIICWKLPGGFLKKAKNLFWIQVVSTGCDQILNLPDFSEKIMLSTAGGIHTTPIAEYVLCYILSICQGSFGLRKLQEQKTWGRMERCELKGKVLGIIGMGNIGREIARKAKAFDMKVTGIKRTEEKVKYTDEIFSMNNLDVLLEKSDFVVIAAPFTPLTRNMIGEKEFQKMKNSAFIINIARGEIVNEKALIYALKNREIAGAVLDVFSNEPLPEDSELWDMENLIITPHISWLTENTSERVINAVTTNIERYLEGEKIKNLVNFKKGY